MKPAARTSWTAEELLAAIFPAPRWAVPGVIPEGCVLLIGPPKLGKSWFVLAVLVAIAMGGRALGAIDVAAGEVLYLALEDNARRLQHRLRIVLGDRPAPPGMTIATECEPMPEAGDRIRAWLDAHPDARLVVVDVLARVRQRTSVRADRYDADYHAVADLKAIADEYGVAILIVHHSRKADADDYVDAVSGTQGLAGAADAVLVLTRSRGASDAVLKVTGRDVVEAEHALKFEPERGAWTLLDGPPEDYAVRDTRRRILQAVRDAEVLTPKQIADHTGLDPLLVRQTVRRMVDAGQLDTDGAGSYFPPVTSVTRVTPPTVEAVTRVTGVTTADEGEER